MLVLTRSKGNTVVIGDDIVVTILGVGRSRCTCAAQHDGLRVQVGIDAPRDLRVLRGEIFDEVRRANLVSLASSDGPVAERVQSLAGSLAHLAGGDPADGDLAGGDLAGGDLASGDPAGDGPRPSAQ